MAEKAAGTSVLLFVLFVAAGCGGGGGGNDVEPPPPVTITITPTSGSLEVGDTLQFSSDVNRSNFSVKWYVNDIEGGNASLGTITTGGLYTAPAIEPNPGTVVIKAVAQVDTTKSVSAQVTVTPKLAVTPTNALVRTGETLQFISNKTATWYVNEVAGGNATLGTITIGGLYTAPAIVPSPETVTIKAAWQANPAKTVSVSVIITATSSVSISPTMLTLAAGATQKFTANVPVDWQLAGVAGNTRALGTIDASGLYAAPLAPPLGGSLQVIAVSKDDPSQQATAIVTVRFSNASLNGRYAFSFSGTTDVDPYYLAGSFVADGQGGLSDTVFDFKDLSAPITNAPFAGSYGVGPDGRGALFVEYGTTRVETHLVMTSADSARAIVFVAGISASGTIERQEPSTFPGGGPSGRFAFAYSGVNNQNKPIAVAGMFTASAGQVISGLQDVNDGGSASGNVNFSGNYAAPDTATGRGTMTFSTGSETNHFAYYMLSADRMLLLSLDLDKAAAGSSLRQAGSFSNASLSGNFVFHSSGGMPEYAPTKALAAGRFTSDGNGTISGGVQDVDVVGTSVNNPFTGTYTIAVNGQGHATFVRTGAQDNLTLYMTAAGSGFFVTRDFFLVASGQIQPQNGLPFSTASLNGNFGFSTHSTQPTSSLDISGQLTFKGQSAEVTGVQDISQGTIQLQAISVGGTFTMSGNGRGVASINLGTSTSTLAIYMIDADTLLLVENDAAVLSKVGSAERQY